ncbi:cyclic nucleotide-binding domain-containing protein [Endozoicomonas sp. SM1973]|uniref:Cyclic nucleotide-binding domain-containing protein n=1 Tax=Spartinivicinus marinus TaxID=2994442 RepID=A0A853I0N1_9GAMM|nr:cyclic nucleotide-binding domain-containing protein [Spartinivicinus marinus]MCX4029790.1 cyclic nucleotide-binding domain-containing protein [Spartinivicinus marinus]NYZ67540.1 cyclic nucleotide-binding domain-containing protein [Spartinivicinus marinus]
MDIKEEVEQLSQVPMFSKMEPSKLRLLAFTSEALCYKDQELLFEQNDPPDSAYVIMSGEVEVVAHTSAGEVVAATRGRNALIGEMAVIMKSPRSATIRAKGEVHVLKINADVFLTLLSENPSVALDVMHQLSAKIAEAQRQYEQLHEQLQV